ncbi:MAG: GNAT family N-acetyltransferase [Brevibacterium sp.]|nr:GNAT family N-acetyltransferase [Brevibacterium sp.]MDN5875292.1 GNAT family N-acetyltransferase [Brevibacterium sp.]MDN5908047.1 GNAT family N-acetyltransferase [Brevibacterium sp.]MDN6173849.1 GNAT family N-acetyltransferase [Brevibacterium sp.]MDN6188213.1 GNAT family N-acetyltransferase [Brevibacterium sp.]
MSAASSLSIRPVETSDEVRWRELFRGYRAFYHLDESEEIVSRVWGWLNDTDHECNGLVVETDDAIVAIADYRYFSRPSTGSVGIWLDDLFTDPAVRGRGAGRALIAHLQEIAAAEGRSVVRWITADDNAQAQVLYDDVATKTNWLTYDAKPTRA